MPSKKNRRGKTRWYGRVQRDGQRIEKVFDTRIEALNWEAQMRQAPESNPEPEPTPVETEIPTVSLLEWATEYLEFSEKFNAKVFSEKKTAFKRLFKIIDPHSSVDAITPALAYRFLNKQFRERSGYAANKDRKNLVAAWNWGIKFLDFPEKNPFQKVDQFPHDEKGHYVPPVADFWKVCDAATGQDRIMLLTYLYTAARRGELYRLRWEDVDFDSQRIRLFTRKKRGGSLTGDWLPMNDPLIEALSEHRKSAANDWVFVQQRGHYKGHPYREKRDFPKNICRRVGVKEFGCHGIRGLTASILAKEDVPMIAIQQVLRHQKLSTTERYVRGIEPVRPYLNVLDGGRGMRAT